MHNSTLPSSSLAVVGLTTYAVVKSTRPFCACHVWRVMHADAVVAAIAAEQHGVIGYRQLILAGLSRRQIERRLESGHLIRLHRGVYAVGHAALPPLAHFVAALIAVGPHAALYHHSSAVLWNMLAAEEGAPVHVAVTTGHPEHRPGIRIHRVKQLDVRYREGLRVTSPAQTLASLAAHSSAATYQRAYDEALKQRLIRDDKSPGFTRSELERRFKGIIEQSGLPTPKYNAYVAGLEVDVLWPEQRYVVEIDSWQFHGHRRAFERDRKRDLALDAAGYRHARVTHEQIKRPLELIATLATALAS